MMGGWAIIFENTLLERLEGFNKIVIRMMDDGGAICFEQSD